MDFTQLSHLTIDQLESLCEEINDKASKGIPKVVYGEEVRQIEGYYKIQKVLMEKKKKRQEEEFLQWRKQRPELDWSETNFCNLFMPYYAQFRGNLRHPIWYAKLEPAGINLISHSHTYEFITDTPTVCVKFSDLNSQKLLTLSELEKNNLSSCFLYYPNGNVLTTPYDKNPIDKARRLDIYDQRNLDTFKFCDFY